MAKGQYITVRLQCSLSLSPFQTNFCIVDCLQITKYYTMGMWRIYHRDKSLMKLYKRNVSLFRTLFVYNIHLNSSLNLQCGTLHCTTKSLIFHTLDICPSPGKVEIHNNA